MSVARYRKKPSVIHAVKWTGVNTKEIEELTEGYYHYLVEKRPDGFPMLEIYTLEGVMKSSIRLIVGDYIIKGIAGEFYPCKPAIFEELHELDMEVPDVDYHNQEFDK
jgi:hypothetical protein